jgi:hypothetical protein
MRKAWMFAPKGKRLSTYATSRWFGGIGGLLAAAAIPTAYRWVKRRSAERRAGMSGGLSAPEFAAPTGR